MRCSICNDQLLEPATACWYCATCDKNIEIKESNDEWCCNLCGGMIKGKCMVFDNGKITHINQCSSYD